MLRVPEPRFNIKMLTYQYWYSHYKDEAVVKPFYLYNDLQRITIDLLHDMEVRFRRQIRLCLCFSIVISCEIRLSHARSFFWHHRLQSSTISSKTDQWTKLTHAVGMTWKYFSLCERNPSVASQIISNVDVDVSLAVCLNKLLNK